MRRGQLKTSRGNDDLFAGFVAMRSRYADQPYPDEEPAPAAAAAVAMPENIPAITPPYTRYCDQTTDWRTRLFGVSSTVMVVAFVLGCAVFTWHTVKPLAVSASQRLTVVDLAPLAAPPEPVKEVAPGPEQVEHQEAKPLLRPEAVVPPPMIELMTSSATALKTNEPVAVIDPGPPMPETTAPMAVSAPAAPRASNNARLSWEGQILARLERFRRYPARARAAREEGITYIRFTLNREGMVISSAIVRKSGSRALDREALDTLKRAQPLPAIPPERPDVVELTLPVEFFLSSAR